jgi:antitoxin ParD1/3/4
MQVTIPSELEVFVSEQVAAGRYLSANDMIRESLTLLREHQQALDALRRDVDAAIAEADAGLCVPFDDALAADVKVRGRQRLAAKGG